MGGRGVGVAYGPLSQQPFQPSLCPVLSSFALSSFALPPSLFFCFVIVVVFFAFSLLFLRLFSSPSRFLLVVLFSLSIFSHFGPFLAIFLSSYSFFSFLVSAPFMFCLRLFLLFFSLLLSVLPSLRRSLIRLCCFPSHFVLIFSCFLFVLIMCVYCPSFLVPL